MTEPSERVDEILRRESDPSAQDGPPLEGPGATIGRYKLLEHLGDGGFGSVYSAEQTEPVVRKVALKLIKLGMDTKQVLARFEAERQALALMDHPSIAKVLDGGWTASGRPYFVMELVRGVSITEYCDRASLFPRQRLELFVEVCNAVQHAHQKGIIHRDIKPSNVLVTLHDGRAVPKVIDFGIAKAIHGRLTERTLFTGLRQFLGTPAYMSPEQAEPGGLDVDTRTDVYSLGVLLYELLTGTTPFDTQRLLESDLSEFQSMIREREPPRPSVRIATSGSAEIARRRGLDARSLRRQLRGDLDWIVMRALEKDRARRYDSVAALGEDVQRHLAHQPVLAGPPSTAYRAAKFVRRHRVGVGAAAAVVLALVAGIVGTSYGLAQALRERARAEAQAADAHRARDESEAVTAFLTDMFESVHPDEAGRDVTVLEVLDLASTRLSTTFGERPNVQSRLHAALGLAYLELGRLDEAERHLLAAQEIRRRTLGLDHVETLRASVNVAALRLQQGRSSEAEELLRTAVEGLTRQVGEDDIMTLGALSNLAVVHARRSHDEETVALHRRVLEGQRRVLGPDHKNTLGAMVNLAELLADMERLEDAEALAREAVAGWERAHGPDAPGTLQAAGNLAMMQARLGRLDEAESRMRRVVEGRERVFGEHHVETLAARANLGFLLSAAGKPGEAESAWITAWEGMRVNLGDDHPSTLAVAAALAEAFQAQGWPERSRSLVASLRETARRMVERQDASAQEMNNLAWALLSIEPHETADSETALLLATRASEADRAQGGGILWMILDTLAAAQHATGAHASAVANQREAIERLPPTREAERGGMEERLRTYESALGAAGTSARAAGR